MRNAATNAVNNMLHTETRLDCKSKTAGSVAKAKFPSASRKRPADRISSSRKPVRQKRPNSRKAAAEAAIAAVVSSATCSAGARYAKLRLATSTSANVAPAEQSAQPTASLRSRSTTPHLHSLRGARDQSFGLDRTAGSATREPRPTEGHSQPIGRRRQAARGPL